MICNYVEELVFFLSSKATSPKKSHRSFSETTACCVFTRLATARSCSFQSNENVSKVLNFVETPAHLHVHAYQQEAFVKHVNSWEKLTDHAAAAGRSLQAKI